MATLKVKVEESIIIDNQDYNSKRVNTITNVNDICKRIVDITIVETGLLGFGATTATDLSKTYAAGSYDVDKVFYIRITNLDSTNFIQLIFRDTDNTEFAIKLAAGHSFIYPGHSSGVITSMHAGGSALTVSFNNLKDITADADTDTCKAEVFVASS